MASNRMPTHHPHDEMLLDYASGAQSPAVALFVATHMALCPTCRAEVARLEALGGMMLDAIEPAPIEGDSLDRMMARLSEPEPAAPATPAPASTEGPGHHLPRPLRDYVDGPLESLRWSPVLPNMEEVRLPLEAERYHTRLLRVTAGTAVPEHGHEGDELVLILTGGLTDVNGHYLAGDCAVTDAVVVHRPFADRGEDCICLVLSTAPRFTGLFGPVKSLVSRYLSRG